MNPEPDAPRRSLVTIKQACTRAIVSKRTIYNWMRLGKLEYCRTAGGHIRIYEDTLFREGQKEKP